MILCRNIPAISLQGHTRNRFHTLYTYMDSNLSRQRKEPRFSHKDITQFLNLCVKLKLHVIDLFSLHIYEMKMSICFIHSNIRVFISCVPIFEKCKVCFFVIFYTVYQSRTCIYVFPFKLLEGVHRTLTKKTKLRKILQRVPSVRFPVSKWIFVINTNIFYTIPRLTAETGKTIFFRL